MRLATSGLAVVALVGCSSVAGTGPPSAPDLPQGTVAIIDTGVAASSEVDLRDQLVCLPECVGDQLVDQSNPHGTQVASVAASRFGDQLPVVSYRVSDRSWIDVAGIANAITDAGRRGIKTINVSISAYAGQDEIARAVAGLPAGTQVIAAASSRADSAPCSVDHKSVVCVRESTPTVRYEARDSTGTVRQVRGSSYAAAAQAGDRAKLLSAQ